VVVRRRSCTVTVAVAAEQPRGNAACRNDAKPEAKRQSIRPNVHSSTVH
jgi:hypothetical protein